MTGTSDADKIDGGGGNDTVNGGNGADTIDGGAGNDTLNSQSGGDTYLYGAGSGNDTIAENTDSGVTDTVKLVGLNIADVSFGRTGENLLITITATSEVLTVQNHFSSTTNGIEQLVFADNTIWNRTDILLHVPAITGTSGNDTLYGTSSDNVFNGGLGNDTIRSSSGRTSTSMRRATAATCSTRSRDRPAKSTPCGSPTSMPATSRSPARA